MVIYEANSQEKGPIRVRPRTPSFSRIVMAGGTSANHISDWTFQKGHINITAHSMNMVSGHSTTTNISAFNTPSAFLTALKLTAGGKEVQLT